MAPDTRYSRSVFSKTESEVGKLSQDLTQFLKCNEETAEKFRQLSKNIFDNLKPEDKYARLKLDDKLEQLIIEDFDDEQIWQEIELRNQPMLTASMEQVPKIAAKVDIDFGVDLISEDDDDEDGSNDDEMMNEEEESGMDADEDSAIESEEPQAEEVAPRRKSISSVRKTPVRKSVVDDDFFRLGNLEEFLEAEDKIEERKLRKQRKSSDSDDGSDEDSIDLFADMASDDEGRDAKYDDFFDPVDDDDHSEEKQDSGPRKKKDRKSVRFADEVDDDDSEEEEERSRNDNGYDFRDAEADDIEEDDTESSLKTAKDLFKDSDDESDEQQTLSSFEKRQKKLMKRISTIEDNRLAEKEWQMRGEITSKTRPENSLMEEHLDFDHQTRQAPQITRTLTQKLEDWICQRIKDRAWDDVVRKAKPVEEVFEFRRRLTLDQEKSKVGLAEVYEQEFLKLKEQQKDETNPEHDEIKKLMNGLFRQLDALSNYHFMPRPAQPDLKIVKNLPTIAAEEVMPASVGDATMLAPEEVKSKPKREVIAKDERSNTDKNRERRLKKIAQKKKQKFQEEKERRRAERDPRFKERLDRKQARENLKNSTNTKVLKTPKDRNTALKSSTKFFERLQDEVSNQISAKQKLKKERELKKTSVGAFKL